MPPVDGTTDSIRAFVLNWTFTVPKYAVKSLDVNKITSILLNPQVAVERSLPIFPENDVGHCPTDIPGQVRIKSVTINKAIKGLEIPNIIWYEWGGG